MKHFFKKILGFLLVSILLYFIVKSSISSNCLENEVKLYLDNHLLCVEIADTKEKRIQGLMFRKTLDPNQGILFIFEYPEILKFWMKNTSIPLDIGFFDINKSLMEYKPMEPFSLEIVSSSKKSLYALEVNQKWFQENKIKIGSTFYLKE